MAGKTGGAWLGTYRIYDVSGKSKRPTVRLGDAGMSRREAQALLTERIKKDNQLYATFNQLGPSGSVPFGWDTESGRHLPPAAIGAVGELLVAADLIKKGWGVFRALSPIASCDLMICKGDVKATVEVKHGYLSNQRRKKVNVRRSQGNFDIVALVSDQGEIRYEIKHEVRGKIVLDLPGTEQARILENSDKPSAIEKK